jgi:hypothetical protein
MKQQVDGENYIIRSFIIWTSHVIIESRSMKWAGDVALVGKKRMQSFGRKPEWKRLIGRPEHKWENDIEIGLRETAWASVGWIDVAQDKGQWQAVMSTEMNLWVPQHAGNFLTSLETVSFSQVCRVNYLYRYTSLYCPSQILLFFFFYTNWKFMATLCWASLSAPFFQQHLLTSCLCVTFW